VEEVANDPASWVLEHYELDAIISSIIPNLVSPHTIGSSKGTSGFQIDDEATASHAVLHARNPEYILTSEKVASSSSSAVSPRSARWLLYNDFTIESSSLNDVLSFPRYRHPSFIFYKSVLKDPNHSFESKISETETLQIFDEEDNQDGTFSVPASVFDLPSLSPIPSVVINTGDLPSCDDLVAFDAEVNYEVMSCVLEWCAYYIYIVISLLVHLRSSDRMVQIIGCYWPA
jgi:hypothetical protein